MMHHFIIAPWKRGVCDRHFHNLYYTWNCQRNDLYQMEQAYIVIFGALSLAQKKIEELSVKLYQ